MSGLERKMDDLHERWAEHPEFGEAESGGNAGRRRPLSMSNKDEAKCPKCRGTLDFGLGPADHNGNYIGAACVSANCTFYSERGSTADLTQQAYFAPRQRLPTPEEETAHRSRHGEGAGWMVRWSGLSDQADGTAKAIVDFMCRFSDYGASIHEESRVWEREVVLFESYPHVNGRPVGWPEVKS